ncbi:hypothetical protein CYMTET_3151 [Cymbomonas tetramitiformis]|uniref:Replication origin-binding protein domain-containing protein n=1 Tax=Cymbomonas tetramitiformis TaxID=36881 RepID=A0AAE0H3Q7_9CHLO|nr:hypothetical protein CYMTET_3151 [Cymbomonas tetramitiformis]
MTLDGLLEFFNEEYNLDTLTYKDFLVADACTAKKFSFHILLRRYRFGSWDNLRQFIGRLKHAVKEAKLMAEPLFGEPDVTTPPNLLAHVDLQVYGKTQAMRTIYSCKPGQENWLIPRSRVGDSEFMNIEDKSTLDFLASAFRPDDQVLVPKSRGLYPLSKRQRKYLRPPLIENGVSASEASKKALKTLPGLPTLRAFLSIEDHDEDRDIPPPHVRQRIEKAVITMLRRKLPDDTSTVRKWYGTDIIGMRTASGGRRCYKMLPPPNVPVCGLHRQNFLILLHDGHVRYHCYCDDPDQTGDDNHLGYLNMNAMYAPKDTRGVGDEYFTIPSTDLYRAGEIDGKPRTKKIVFKEGVRVIVMREEMGTGKTHQAMEFIRTYHTPRTERWVKTWYKDNVPHLPFALTTTNQAIQSQLPPFYGDRVLVIFHRRSLGRSMFQDSLDAMTFTYYLDVDKTSEIADVDRLAICVDSLWRVKTTDWDLVVVDEINSVLRNIRVCKSTPSGAGGKIAVWLRLLDILRDSHRVVLMDAMADVEVSHTLHAAGVVDEEVVWRNMKQLPLSNLTYQFVLGYKTTDDDDCSNDNVETSEEARDDNDDADADADEAMPDVDDVSTNAEESRRTAIGRTNETGYEEVLQLLQVGNRLYIPSCEKGDMLKLHRLCESRFPDKLFICIHGGLQEEEKNRLIRGVCHGELLPDALFVSPTMVAGNSIDYPHYDVCILRLNARTICSEEVMQIILRVRQLEKRLVTFNCDSRLRDWDEEVEFKYHRLGDKGTGRPSFYTPNHPNFITEKSLKAACATLSSDPTKYTSNHYYMQTSRSPYDWYRLTRVLKPPLATDLDAFRKLTNPAMVLHETKKRMAIEGPSGRRIASALRSVRNPQIPNKSANPQIRAPQFDPDEPLATGNPAERYADIERALMIEDPARRHAMWTNPKIVPLVELLTKFEKDDMNMGVQMIPDLKRLLKKQGAVCLPTRREYVSEKKLPLSAAVSENRKLDLREKGEAIRATPTPTPTRMKELIAKNRASDITPEEELELTKGYAVATYGALPCFSEAVTEPVEEREESRAAPDRDDDDGGENESEIQAITDSVDDVHTTTADPTERSASVATTKMVTGFTDERSQRIYRTLCAMKSPSFDSPEDYVDDELYRQSCRMTPDEFLNDNVVNHPAERQLLVRLLQSLGWGGPFDTQTYDSMPDFDTQRTMELITAWYEFKRKKTKVADNKCVLWRSATQILRLNLGVSPYDFSGNRFRIGRRCRGGLKLANDDWPEPSYERYLSFRHYIRNEPGADDTTTPIQCFTDFARPRPSAEFGLPSSARDENASATSSIAESGQYAGPRYVAGAYRPVGRAPEADIGGVMPIEHFFNEGVA